MSEFIRLRANGVDAFPDASTQNTYRPNGTSVENALVALESNVTTLGGVAGDAKTLAEQNSVKIATAEQEISGINSSLGNKIKVVSTKEFTFEGIISKGSGTFKNTAIPYVDGQICIVNEITNNGLMLSTYKSSDGYWGISACAIISGSSANAKVKFTILSN